MNKCESKTIWMNGIHFILHWYDIDNKPCHVYIVASSYCDFWFLSHSQCIKNDEIVIYRSSQRNTHNIPYWHINNQTLKCKIVKNESFFQLWSMNYGARNMLSSQLNELRYLHNNINYQKYFCSFHANSCEFLSRTIKIQNSWK